MTHMEKCKALRADTAVHYNCAQAVAMPFCEEMGLEPALVKRATEGFGAGMGLPNMKKYTDSMEIETRIGEGTTITMRVSL